MTQTIKYTKKTDIQHVLDCSDVYIGSVQSERNYPRKEYIFDNGKITLANVTVPTALVRIFVETLTNAVDNAERSLHSENECKNIKIGLDLESGLTSVWNDGQIISIDKNNSENIYNHSLIFGHFRTSSNYGHEEVRELSGKNGMGVKCTNIFSSRFSVTGIDPQSGLKLTQTWENNMEQTTGPLVTQLNSKIGGYTEVKYIPDFKRFKIDGKRLKKYPEEMEKIVYKFAIDTSILLSNVNVYFNGKKIKVAKNFADYTQLYHDPSEIPQIAHFKTINSEVVICGFQQSQTRPAISFVNGQITVDGGQHVVGFSKALYTSVLEKLNKKKDSVKFTTKDVSPYFQLFIHSRVNKPQFDGQNKNKLVHPSIPTDIPVSQIKKILKWATVEAIKNKASAKDLSVLKKIEHKNRRTLVKVDGYDSANVLGKDSILIVCEGLSAKSYAVSGIQTGTMGKKGRNHFGILPLRGKFLNVKNVTSKKIGENKVVSDLIKVLGLKFGVDYTLPQHYNSLNYGTLLVLTDADKDGIHIEGLLINFFAELFPSLIKREGFIVSMKTPIVKVFQKGKKDLLFYNESTFEEYRRNHPNVKNFKYYKGLGTTGPKDVSSSFGLKMVKYAKDSNCDASINKVFKDEMSDRRKEWLSAFDPKAVHFNLDEHETSIIDLPISEFMEHEMIKFSYEDCKRSLASVVDGFKESQRKVIFAIRKKFKNGSKTSVKVAQLSGCVAEQTDYKHGEQNLCETIIKFAQDFVGSNNIPLLYPDGQFGTRLEGGKDSASPRYIFTKPQPILKLIFREEDDDILEYSSEGEPITFVPIIPLILVNGSVGIGTGWSCFVPQYNPQQIITHLIHKLNGETHKLNLVPYYKNFKGKIKPANDEKTKFLTYGKMKQIDENTIAVTELPIGMWTGKFKEQCETLIEKGLLSSLIDQSTTTDIDFSLKGLETINALKLTTTLHTTNMVLFNHKNIITKYECIDDIMEEYYKLRLKYYALRRLRAMDGLEEKISISLNKLNFILKVVEDKHFLKQEDNDIIHILETEQFKPLNNSYNYLLNLSIRSFTLNKVEELRIEIEDFKKELLTIQNTTPQQMWIKELKELENII